jgi:shikimate kinase
VLSAILISGQAGAGKTTLGEELSSQGWDWFDLDDRQDLAPFATEDPGLQYHEAWRPHWGWRAINLNALRMELTQRRRPMVVTGVTINQDQAFFMFDQVFWLSMTVETLFARLDARGSLKDLDADRRARYPRNMLLMEGWALHAGATRIDANQDQAGVLHQLLAALAVNAQAA